jgi:hypothetical protein
VGHAALSKSGYGAILDHRSLSRQQGKHLWPTF